MDWDIPHRRTAGFIVDVTRHPSAYAVLGALYDGPHQRPKEIRAVLEHHASFRAGLGVDPLPKGIVTRRLADFHDDGLVIPTRLSESGTAATYELSPLGAGLVESLDPLGRWALSMFPHLVRVTREHNGVDPEPTIATQYVAPSPLTARLAAEMALDLLNSRWAFAVLVYSSGDGMSPSALEERINAGIGVNPDLAWRRLNQSTRHDSLNWLEHAGVIAKTVRRRPGRFPQVRYQASKIGEGMLDALWHAGDWGKDFDAALYRAIAIRNRFPET